MAGPLIEGVQRLEALEIPTLALVHGLCLTAGLEVALGCDIIWAEESSKFGLVEAVVGLTPGRRRHPADGRAGGPGPGARVRDDRAASTTPRRSSAGASINRVVPDGTVHEKGMRFAAAARERPDRRPRGDEADRARLSPTAGSSAPTRSRPGQFAELFATEDLQNAVRSFLADGPGKATFEGN